MTEALEDGAHEYRCNVNGEYCVWNVKTINK